MPFFAFLFPFFSVATKGKVTKFSKFLHYLPCYTQMKVKPQRNQNDATPRNCNEWVKKRSFKNYDLIFRSQLKPQTFNHFYLTLAVWIMIPFPLKVQDNNDLKKLGNLISPECLEYKVLDPIVYVQTSQSPRETEPASQIGWQVSPIAFASHFSRVGAKDLNLNSNNQSKWDEITSVLSLPATLCQIKSSQKPPCFNDFLKNNNLSNIEGWLTCIFACFDFCFLGFLFLFLFFSFQFCLFMFVCDHRNTSNNISWICMLEFHFK